MAIPSRRLDPDGPEVGVIALGSWQTWERMLFEDAVELAARAVENGVNFFDTGNYNSGPHTEGSNADVLFGRIMEAAGVARGDYVLALTQWLWTLPEQSLEGGVETNLFRVGTDYADVLLLGHYNETYKDKFGIDLRELIADVAAVVERGWARGWAITNWPAADARYACELATAESLPPPLFVQMKYSVARRTIPEGEPYEKLFADTELTMQAADVLEGGALIGRDPARKIGRDAGGVIEQIRAGAPRLIEAAEALDATPAQLAIAFSLTHPATTSVLLGASRIEQLEDNLGAVALLERCGEETVRAAVEDLCVDRGVVDPAAMS